MTTAVRGLAPVLVVSLLLVVLPGRAGAQDARRHYNRGRDALALDDLHEAVHSFRSALNINPSYLEARLGMIKALFLLTEFEEAYREIESARIFAPDNRDLALLEARILVALGRDEEAAEIYFGILEGRPHDAEANRGLAEFYAITGQRELAESTFDRSLRYAPGDKRVLMHLVLLRDEALNRAGSEAVMQEALRLFPDDYHVRMLAAEHYALYDDWYRAEENLDRAKAMLSGADDPRFSRVVKLDASLALRRNDPASALELLGGADGNDDPAFLFLLARAFRGLGEEEKAQEAMGRLISMRPEDEIARMYREESLVRTIGGFERDRAAAAAWHIEAGRRYEEAYYYDRALSEYRRARLIDGTNPDVWITYAELIRKKGFPEKYRDALEGASLELEGSGADASAVRRRIALLDHSQSGGIAEDWGIDDPWMHDPASWDVAVFIDEKNQSLPYHAGSAPTLAYFFADLADMSPRIRIVDPDGGFGLEIGEAESFSDAFRRSRGKADYFIMIEFFETERSFGSSAVLYLSRTGEPVGQFSEIRTGRGRVDDALAKIVEEIDASVPNKMRILAVDDNRVLLDKGRWHGIISEDPLPVLRSGSGRPFVGEGGITYSPTDFLGTVSVNRVSESLCEGTFEKAGDFDFVAAGDEAFLLPVPEGLASLSAPDPAFRSRLLSVP